MKTKIYAVAYYDSELNYIAKTSIFPFALSGNIKGIKPQNVIDDTEIEVIVEPCLLQEKHLHLLIKIANNNTEIIITGGLNNINEVESPRFYDNKHSYRSAFFKMGNAKANIVKKLVNLKLIEMAEKEIESKYYPNVSKLTNDGKAIIHHIMQIEPSNYNRIVNRFSEKD